MKTNISHFIDFKKVDSLLEGFNKSTGFVTAILDLEGNVLSKSGWRQMCTEFHRVNPETSKKCTISDTELANKMGEGEKYHFYKCLNGLVDVAVPIVINGEHIANLFSGQFFFEEPDSSFFKKQAEKYGFDEEKYLAALKDVPVVSEEKVKTAMDFLLDMTRLISETTFQKLEQTELNKNISESEEKFKAVFESANVGKSITLPTGEINVNQAFCKMLGYTREELQNKKWQDITPEDEIPTIQAFTNPLLKGEKDSARFEKRYICKNGTHIWADVSVSIRRDKIGKPLHFITTVIDITERKQAEKSIVESEMQYRSLFENMNAGFVLFQVVQNEQEIPVDLIILAANEGFEKTTGLNLKDAVGQHLTEVLPGIEKDEADWIGTYTKVALTGEATQFEQGSELLGYYYSISAFQAGPRQCAVTFLDITGRKRAETEILQQQYYLNKAQEIGSIGTWELDLIKNELFWTEQNYKNFGVPLGTPLTYDIFLECIHPDDRDYVNGEWVAAIGGKPYDIEHRLIVDGKVRWVREKADIEFDDNNKAIRAIGFTQDITERKKLEIERQKFFMLAESSSEFIGMCDLELNPLYVNPAGRRMVGLPDMESACSVKVQDYYFPEDQQFIAEDFFPRVLREGHGDVEIRLRHFQTGEAIWVYYYLFRVCDDNGKPIGWATVSRNITERRQAEQALHESEERFRKAFEEAPMGIAMASLTNGKIFSTNKALCEMLGYTEDEFQQLTFIDVTYPDDLAADMEAVKNLLEGRIQSHVTEKRYICKNGEKIWVLRALTKISNTGGKPDYALAMIRDITDVKQAEELNRKSAERAKMQRNLIAKLSFEDVIVNKNIDEALEILTTQLAEILKVERTSVWLLSEDDKFLKRTMLFDSASGIDAQVEVLKPADLPSYFKALYKDSQIDADDAQNDPRTKELNDNYFIPLQISSMLDSAIQQDGRLIGVLSAEHRGPVRQWHDDEKSFLSAVTNMVAQLFANAERKQAEENLSRMSSIMSNSQEIAHLGSFEYVAATQTTIWSEEEYRIYGLDPSGPSPEYNEMLEKCIHPDDAKLLHDTFVSAMQSQGIYELEHRIVRPDGSVRWVYDKAHPHFDENGNLLRYVGATLDITERKLLQQELEILNADLEKKVKQRTALLQASNKELEAFSYSVSHDLRAPLRHINGFVDLLSNQFKNELPDKAHHYLDTISGASRQMGTLIDELLQYSRTGRQELRKTELDMNLLVKEVTDQLISGLGERKINWDIQMLPKVFGDYNLLKLVWTNLLDNAVKYSRNNQTAKIWVAYKEEANDFVFCVRDNGVGFDMKYAHKLFGVFQRLHSMAEFEGTGIGLANVQRIVHKHLGKVWAEAEPGKGAKFFFSLPKISEKT